MKTVAVFFLLCAVCSVSAAGLQDNHIRPMIEQRAESDPMIEQRADTDPRACQSCPADVQSLLRDLSVKVAVLQTEVDNLQRQNQEQAEKLREVDALKCQQHEQTVRLTEVEKQSSQVEALKLQQHEQADSLSKVELQQQEQTVRLTEVEKQSSQTGDSLSKVQLQQQEQADSLSKVELQQHDHAADLKSLKSWSNETEQHVDSLRRERAVRKVAFTATLRTAGEGHTGPFNTHTPLVFRNVISNFGNAYNPNTGDFIAPVRGVYHFELHITGVGGSHQSGAFLVKNGQNVVVAFQTELANWNKASNAATLLLEVNDIVYVRLWANTRVYENGNRHSTFSGRLLFTV